MPLDGFRILDWASTTFGGLPPMFLGGLGLVVLVAGISIAVAGLRMTPVSYALLAAGAATALLTYFIVGAAVAAASSTAVGNEQVASAAPRMVPGAVFTAATGLGLFALRAAGRLWGGEEVGQKVGSLMVAALGLVGILAGVQVLRGSYFPHATANDATPAAVDDGSDDVERPAHGLGGSRR